MAADAVRVSMGIEILVFGIPGTVLLTAEADRKTKEVIFPLRKTLATLHLSAR